VNFAKNEIDAKNMEFLGKMNMLACMKDATEGYCGLTFPASMNSFGENLMKPSTNPLCSTKNCPRRIMSAYYTLDSEYNTDANSKEQAAAMEGMLDFVCTINPVNNQYCAVMMDSSANAPWESAACNASWGAEGNAVMGDPPLNRTAPTAGEISTACKASLVTDAAKYGCCVEEITDLVATNDQTNGPMQKAWINGIFQNAGATLDAKCDKVAIKSTVTIDLVGVKKTDVDDRTNSVKADLVVQTGLPKSQISFTTTEKTTRRRLGEPEHRRLAAVTTELIVTLGTQTEAQSVAAAKSLSTDLQMKQLDTDLTISGVASPQVTSACTTNCEVTTTAPAAAPTAPPTAPPIVVNGATSTTVSTVLAAAAALGAVLLA